MTRPPPVPFGYDSIPQDHRSRHELLLEVLGTYLVWMRDNATRRGQLRLESKDARNVGNMFRAVYDTLGALEPAQRAACVEFAQRCVDDFAKQLLGFLATTGDDYTLGQRHAIRLRLDVEAYDVETDALVASETVNRGGDRHLPDMWGRWINRRSSTGDSEGSRE